MMEPSDKTVEQQLHDTVSSSEYSPLPNKTEEALDVKDECVQESSVAEAWMEVRAYFRKIHRIIIKMSQTSGNADNQLFPQSSESRIKKLADKLVKHDPQQLFLRVHQLSYEFCIELKVRLLATVTESPDCLQARRFIQTLCECYQWVMNVCETTQHVLETLDKGHLTSVGLNWTTVNMHSFYAAMYADLDVQEYLATCMTVVSKVPSAAETIGCFLSLRRTLSVAENLWTRAVKHLDGCSFPRASLVAHSTIGVNWSQSNASCKIPFSEESVCTKNGVSSKSLDMKIDACPCRECATVTDSDQALSTTVLASQANEPPNCACHFCDTLPNGSQVGCHLGTSEVNMLPPLTQPQLSLYPHIHGNSSEILSAESMSRYSTFVPGQSVSKPIAFDNSYLGSDLLTQQLIREWELTYGDTLTPPGINHGIDQKKDDSQGLINGLQSLSLTNSVPNMLGSNSFMPINVPSSNFASHPSGMPGAVNSSGVIAHTSSFAPYPMLDKRVFDGDLSGNEASAWTSSDESAIYSSEDGLKTVPSTDCGKDASREELERRTKKSRRRARYFRSRRNCCRHRRHDDENGDEEVEDDGALAELRRRAPDVTITVVKPGQKYEKNGSDQPQVSVSRSNSRNQSRSSTSYVNKDIPAVPVNSWMPPSDPSFQPPIISPDAAPPVVPKTNKPSEPSSSLGDMLKSLDSKKNDKDSGSQMVTIRRVVDPVNSEPTVTITLKGPEPKEDKVLFKLVNGQASGQEKHAAGEPYEIPEGLSASEARTYKNKLKKERKKQKLIAEKKLKEQEELKNKLQLEEQHKLLREQEKELKLKQAALKKKRQQLNAKDVNKNETTKTNSKSKNNPKNLEMTHQFNLPPGVSLKKVAGQPGIVTISNNRSASFCQPYLSNPNLAPSFDGYSLGSKNPMSASPNPSLQFFNNSNMPRLNNGNSCQQDNMIVVDTNATVKKSKPMSKEDAIKQWFEGLTSEEKVELAVAGEIDVTMLNKTQTKKYKKQLRIKEAEEAEREKQKLEEQAAAAAKKKANKKGTNKNNNAKAQVPNKSKDNTGKGSQKTKPSNDTPPITNKKDKLSNKILETQSVQKNKNNKTVKSEPVQSKPLNKQSADTKSEPGKTNSIKPEVSKPKNGENKPPVKNQITVTTGPKEKKNKPIANSVKIKTENKKPPIATVNKVESKKKASDIRSNAKTKCLSNVEQEKSYRTTQKSVPNFVKEPTPVTVVNKREEESANRIRKNKSSFEENFTIDSVFAPKLNMSGEIADEAEREVEAFKRFCYDHPKPSGEKPKVNLNVKDIFRKKNNFS